MMERQFPTDNTAWEDGAHSWQRGWPGLLPAGKSAICTMEVATDMKFAMQVPQVMKSVIKIATQIKITMESGS